MKNDNAKNGGLKNVDIKFEIISFQCSWIKQLCDSSTCDWKLIPLYIITETLIKHCLFHSNLYIDKKNYAIC